MTIARKEFFPAVLAFAILMLALFAPGASAATAPNVAVLSPVTEGVSTPIRVAIDPVGNFYVTDPRGGGVLKYDSAGKLLQKIATGAPPLGIALTQGGNLVVGEGDAVVLMDRNGAELRKLGKGAGQFKMANGIAVDAAGFIYVVDSLDDCVQVFNAAGDFSLRFGTSGNLPGQFSMPTGIAYEKVSNQLAVVDTLNGRIQFFDFNGVYQRTIGSSGSGPLKFSYAMGIAFEYGNGPVPVLNRMYVVDAFQGNLQAIDPTGSGVFLSFIGSYGSGPGMLMAPTDAVFDPAGKRLLVANGYGNLPLFGIDQSPALPDTTPPPLTLNPVPASATAASLLVSGTVEAGATVTVSVNNAPAAAASVAGTDWNITVFLAAGANSITVKATDAAGNATTRTAATSLDVSAGIVTIDPVAAFTSVATQTITGTRQAGAIVSVATGTAALAGAVTYPTAASWKSVITGLAEGDNVITVTGRSTSGATATAAATVTLDTTAPALTVSALANGSYGASRVQNISGFVADPHLDKVAVNGVPRTVSNGFFSAAVELGNGTNSIAVTATDLAGNVRTDTRTVSFDPARQLLTVATPADGISTKTAVLSLNGTVAANCTVSVNGAPAAVSGTGWSATVNLAAGVNTIDVSAKDLAGNIARLKRTVILDTARPELAIAAPPQDTASNSGSLAVTGTAAAGSTLTYAVNGVPAPLALVNGEFGLTAQFPAEGAYAIAVTATDAAGASSVAIRNVNYDRTPPSLTINPADAPAPTAVSGTADPGATVSAADKNGAVGSVVTTGGTWSLDLTGVGYDPATLAVTAVDAAGNAMTRILSAAGPDGDLDGDGRVTISDALRTLRIAVKLNVPTASDLVHGDVGPLAGGALHPDGTIDLTDALLILRKAVGLQSW